MAKRPTYKELEDKIAALESEAAERERIREIIANAQAAAHIGNWEHDVAGGRIAASDEAYRICGIPPQSMKLTEE